ncbi:dihydroorotase [Novipirellula artificiosorum]|uniref:Dihydroorotase n=1 Tax=Novipirellula artificiosorum TaxID=2528016 RepID=A0A5C6D993_9BACT|nr:dihydroorotase [Novipirellula artificiosorum]TWU33318.1 Dihydroorotase [Novipirellula artificiosorum]
MSDLLIENGRLVDPSQGIDRIARLLILDGRVAAIDPSDDEIPSHCHSIDASGRIVAPGLVDLGVELREPGFEEDETIESTSDAALAGGFTSILCTASTTPVVDSPGAVEFVRQKAAKANGVRVYVIGCLSREQAGDQMAELRLLADAGAVAVSDAPRPMCNDALLKRSLDYCRMLKLLIIDRPEVPELAENGVMHDGQVSLVLGLKGLPTEAEDLAVARDVRLAEATEGRLHVGPVSTMGAVDMIRRVKSREIKVTSSVCPHNLCLDDKQLTSFDSRFKVHPPLRSPRHVQTLKEAVADGTIDAIQSGHMPRSREKKMNDLNLAPFGAATLETTLSTVATFMVNENFIDWPTAIERLSTAPARIASVPGGTLAVGSPGDVVIIDPEATWKVNAYHFRSHCISNPLDGSELRARVTHTIVGGTVRFQLAPDANLLAN